MTTYFDSSALAAIYVTGPFSTVTRRETRSVRQVAYTPIHALEVPNAIRALHGRTLVTARELREFMAQLESDLEAQLLFETRLDLFAVFDRATEISRL